MKRFIKTDIATLPEMAALSRVHPAASAILHTLMTIIAEDKNEYGGVMVANAELQKLVGYSGKTITEGVKVLTEYGFIGVAKVGRNNAYILNPDVMTMEKGKHLTYTHIDKIKVIVTDTESELFKESIERMRRAKKFKQVKSSAALNNRKSLKTGGKVKESVVVDRVTGEVIKEGYKK